MPRVAIASTDGKFINEHFGRASFFHIIEITDDTYKFVESRDAVACCQQQSHNESDFDRVISLLTDCDAILVSRIGWSAAAYLISKGIRVFESPGFIDDVIKKVISDKLLDENPITQTIE